MDASSGGRLSSVVTVKSKQTIPEKISIAGNIGLLSSQATLAFPFSEKYALYVSGRKINVLS